MTTRRRRRVRQAILGGPGAATMLVMLAPFVAAFISTGAPVIGSASVQLVDQATDAPAPPASPAPPLPPGTALPPGAVVLPGGLPLPPVPPGTVLPPGATVLPGGPNLPPLPKPVDLSVLGSPEVQQMWSRMMQLQASPPSNVPDEVCRFNTVRVPC